MQILRIFPGKRNQYTPTDSLAYCANYNPQPPMLSQFPAFDEVHISCCFTWDKAFCKELKYQLEGVANKPVLVGGPAFESPATGFTQGLYLKSNVTFTSRGCNNACPWCIVPRIEGELKELSICQGNVIQDNNFLQTNRQHKDKAFDMLRTQKGICFKGGLESDLIDDHFISAVTSLRIKELWLACDTDESLAEFIPVCERLAKAGFSSHKIRCYALIGDNMDKNEARLRRIYEAGAMPSAQLYRDFGETKTEYSEDWRWFEQMWQRPASVEAHMKKGTNFRDFHRQEDKP